MLIFTDFCQESTRISATVLHFVLFLLDILPKHLCHMQCRRALPIIECKEIFA